MSTVPGGLALGGSVTTVQRLAPLSTGAKVYFGAVTAATIAAAAPRLALLDLHTRGWPTFLILAGAAAVAQLFVVTTVSDYSLHTAIVFLIAAALLLPPELVALMGVVQHVPGWLRHRQAWYVRAFNICNYTLNGLAAWWAADLVMRHGATVDDRARWALAGLAACVVFIGLNHLLLALRLYLGRGERLRETDLFTWGNLSTELMLAALGIGLAGLWHGNPWLVPFGIAPLLLIHRSLHVPRLEEQARIDPKTGLFNARHFSTVLNEELARAARFGRPVSLIMADLDLLREINNTYGHLAGDVVLAGIADVFRTELRHYDVPSRFGGEEFAILLPETSREHAFAIADRVRRAVAAHPFEVETSTAPLHATISMGVASFPKDGQGPNELVHHADLAVYRAKLQGRNRVLAACDEPAPLRGAKPPHVITLRERTDAVKRPASQDLRRRRAAPVPDRRRTTRHAVHGPRLLALSARLVVLVGAVACAGVALGIAGLILGTSRDVLGLLALTVLVGVARSLALELDNGSLSVGAVGALTGAALFGPRAALPLAAATALVEWSERRSPPHRLLFNVGTLSLAAMAAAGTFELGFRSLGEAMTVVAALCAAGTYYLTNTGLLSLALAVEGRESWFRVWLERFSWLAPRYLCYGLLAGILSVAYHAAGLYSLALAVGPLIVLRNAQAAYRAHTRRSTQELSQAAATIEDRDAGLERANRLLRERSTAAMERVSATVDARGSFTAGHSRRVQQLALAIGRELGLSPAELDVLSHAALFHDIGKLGIPDAILLKPARLDPDEWGLMQRHSDEGAGIVERLGFLEDAVPAIRHHHERYDGTGYPDRLRGEQIPLGARIVHVADALDSMLTTQTYRAALTRPEALAELRRLAGRQFCPRCVAALERIPERSIAREGDSVVGFNLAVTPLLTEALLSA